MKYRATRAIGTKGRFVEILRGIAVDAAGRIFAVGDSKVVVLEPEGEVLREWPTDRPGHCVALDGDGRVWVGQAHQVEIFDEKGTLLDTWKDPERPRTTDLDG